MVDQHGWRIIPGQLELMHTNSGVLRVVWQRGGGGSLYHVGGTDDVDGEGEGVLFALRQYKFVSESALVLAALLNISTRSRRPCFSEMVVTMDSIDSRPITSSWVVKILSTLAQLLSDGALRQLQRWTEILWTNPNNHG